MSLRLQMEVPFSKQQPALPVSLLFATASLNTTLHTRCNKVALVSHLDKNLVSTFGTTLQTIWQKRKSNSSVYPIRYVWIYCFQINARFSQLMNLCYHMSSHSLRTSQDTTSSQTSPNSSIIINHTTTCAVVCANTCTMATTTSTQFDYVASTDLCDVFNWGLIFIFLIVPVSLLKIILLQLWE